MRFSSSLIDDFLVIGRYFYNLAMPAAT